MQTHWIRGEAVASGSLAEIPVVNPATEEVIDTIPQGCDADIESAVGAAQRAFPAWAALAPVERRPFFSKIADKLQQHQPEIARLLTMENGKPYRRALWEAGRLSQIAISYAELAVHLRCGVQSAPFDNLVFQHRVPRGVAACVMPWNYPLDLSFEGLMPCLAAGNTAVWKPSEKTPLATRLLAELVFDDLPCGVVNILLGDGPYAGAGLVAHPGVKVVVFVGSARTGKLIARSCAEQLKKCVLELGGKDALIVDDTVNIEAAVKFAAEGVFSNSGQVCTSTERLYVHNSVFEPFVSGLVGEAAGLKLGDGLEDDSDLGPVVDDLQLQRIVEHVEEAVSRGAVIRHGGKRLNRPGFFFPPTVITDVPKDCRLMSEETFGPVAPVIPFDEFDEALALANDSAYGLGVIVCTNDAPRAIRAIETVETGMVKINTQRGKAPGSSSEPAKDSGAGYGYGTEIFNEVTRMKSVHWRAQLPPEVEWF